MKYKLNTQPYKGTKDYYPKDMQKRNYIFDIWKETALEFGYEEYDTPLLEEANLYRAKSGDELANTQLYNFVDKGDREVAIRPEMTPSLARMIAAKITELPKPIRWFNIGKYYRYEKPQRGRSREFFQLNIDILGIDSTEAEIEIFAFINSVMKKFKADPAVWRIYFNNRKLVDYIFTEVLNLDETLKSKVARAIDNYTKVKPSEYPQYLKDTGLNDTQVSKLLDFLKSDTQYLETLDTQGANEVLNIINRCSELGIINVEYKPYIMRGLAYYTGTVIELFDIGSKDNPRALFGGGRYDDLLTIFDKDTIPAFGLGWGNITTEDFLDTYNLFPEYKSETQVFITLGDSNDITKAGLVAKQLRENGIKVEQQLKPGNTGKQLEYAIKKGIRFVIFLNDSNIELKDLSTREQKKVSERELVKFILGM